MKLLYKLIQEKTQDPYVRRDDPSVWRDQYGTEYVGRHERVHPEPCHDNECPNWRTYYEALKRGDQQTMTTMEKNTEREIFKTSGLSKGDYHFIGNLIFFFVFWGLIWLVAYKVATKVYEDWNPKTTVGKSIHTFLKILCAPLWLVAALGQSGTGRTEKREEITIIKDGKPETYIKK